MCGRTIACSKSTATRAVYVAQFILVSIVAYVFSYWAYKWLPDVPVLKECKDGVVCAGALTVFRITFGLTLYHAALCVFLIGVRSSTDWRATIQDGWFPVKFIALVGLIVVSFFIPNSFFKVYGWIMVVGAGFFIIVQLVLLIEFAYSWAETWLLKMEDEEMDGTKKWYTILLTATFTLIAGGLALTIASYKFFSGSGCGVNTFFITFNLIAALIYCVLSITPKVREGRPSSGLLQSAVIFLYSAYLVWSSMMSEPTSDGCNPFSGFSQGSASQTISLILGAVFTVISVVYATVKAGSSSDELLGTGSDVEKPLVQSEGGEDGEAVVHPDDEKEGTRYNYSFFHISFALGAMYVCMLLTNWMTITGIDNQGVAVDTGNVSVWVKIVSSWVTIAMYLWTLAAPVLLPDREWN